MSFRLRTGQIRWMVTGLAILLSQPLLPAPWIGLYLWGSPFLVLNGLLAGKGLVVWQVLALVTLVLSLYRKRWICRYACPTGALCELCSKASPLLRPSLRISFNRGLAVAGLILALFGVPVLTVLDPFNLFFMGFAFSRNALAMPALLKASGLILLLAFTFLFPGLWCRAICPLGGVQDLLHELKKFFTEKRNGKTRSNSGRRRFLLALAGGTGAGISGGILLPGFFRRSVTRSLRPPFALPEAELNAICIRCGSCSAACPTGIIRASADLQHPESLLTPVVEFSEGYCLSECHACGQVCPSGAISPFRSEDKAGHIMGTAEIARTGCYLQQGKECSLCVQYCPYDAVKIPAGLPGEHRVPRFIRDKCTGCGACQVVCPPGAILVLTPKQA